MSALMRARTGRGVRRAAAVLAVATAAGVALAWTRRRLVLITVRGNSMTPTYADGQRLLLRRGGYAPADVVVFRSPLAAREGIRFMVKRVAAMPGDPVPADMAGQTAVTVVPPGRLLVRSDAGGLDSRHFGLVDHAHVLGRICAPHPGPEPGMGARR
jgi:signal peptidase I